MRSPVGVLCAVGIVGLCCAVGVYADENEGQPDLDKAIQTKLSAETFAELGTVIDLCQGALDKGLDKGNEEFCRQLLASTLLQRAEALTRKVFDVTTDPGPQRVMVWRMALADVERAVEVDGKQATGQLLLGKLLLVGGNDRTRAVQALDKAIELAKDDNDVKAEALQLRGRTREDIDDRLNDLSAAVKLAPENAEIVRERGTIYLGLNRIDDALADFDAALKVDEDDAATHEARGIALGLLQRYKEARESFSRMAELSPESAMPLLQRARMNALMEKFDESVEDATRALEIDPDNVDGLIIKSQALALAGKAAEAIADADRALELKPDSDDVVRIWAMVTEKAGNTDTAIEELRKQVEFNPDDSVAWLQLGLLYGAEHQSLKAIDAFTAAIKTDREREFAYQVRADTYLGRGMQKEAIADYEQSLKLDETNSGVLNNLAWVLATSTEGSLRDGGRAIALATKACELTHYKQAHILSTLAAAYAETGDFKTAKEWSQKSVDIGDEKLKDQLRKELASYEREEPWREKQEETK
ncbi:MAG TPA: tetratricopeptide repeat protein [Pirellulales bacterium]|nr:tetratricopeptide repeat protein [Pirellulales bacterium]